MSKKAKEEPAPYAWVCGFCGPGSTGDPEVCYDKNQRCPGWIAGTQCACAAAGHHLAAERAA